MGANGAADVRTVGDAFDQHLHGVRRHPQGDMQGKVPLQQGLEAR
jgi:hypothetical protein